MATRKSNLDLEVKDLELSEIGENIGLQATPSDLIIYDSSKDSSEAFWNRAFRSEHFSMVFLINGTLSLKVNLLDYALDANSVIIIPPSSIRQLTWDFEDTKFISLLFTPEFLKSSGILGKYFNVANFLRQGLSTHRKINEEDQVLLLDLIEIIAKLQVRTDDKDLHFEMIKNIFKSILIKVKPYYDEMETDPDYSNTIIYRFIKLLSEFYLSNREVTFYSEKLSINEKYLSQLLKKKTGKTARQFITEMVVLEAKVLLDNRSLPVKYISDHLNFENQFHFSRFFKQYSGMSPSNYRKQVFDMEV
ncbi:helix-turn-helix domain-containing protein [Chryseobacterium caseinilyticum]|uniref:AraC family transcriptional regulator n=1 Tax=Chryseobacterium caseinilyticum TaxID=2771428 RepID=A0ABR8ZC51_9FLAO|nr:helix-turn-helix domain-containing protein [Chryseobacterium caseinilyticum]MBD8082816.1 AraC family transcriptional regulator [Chryseobacterium caseinilyticum]